MKLNLGKSLLKGLEVAGGVAVSSGSVCVALGDPISVKTTGIVAVVAGLIRAIVNVIKTVRKIKRGAE